MDFECAACGEITTLPARPKKFLCKWCGAPNNPVGENFGTADQAASCLLPTGFEWRLPAGVIGDSEESMLYIAPDDGATLSRIEWIEIYGYDPKAKLADMRRRGQEGVPGYTNLSTLGRKKK
jgi:hypothetical protein